MTEILCTGILNHNSTTKVTTTISLGLKYFLQQNGLLALPKQLPQGLQCSYYGSIAGSTKLGI